MKTKKFSMKLTLNKKTIANLSNNAMREVLGGEYPPTYGRTSCRTVCFTDHGGGHLCPWNCV
jgi:hypothetical protein